MPSYSYKQRFVPFILDGSKLHTIRKRRRYPPKPGSIIYHYYALRTKQCKKLGADPFKDIKSIYITAEGNIILISPCLSDDWCTAIDEEGILKHIPTLVNQGYTLSTLSGIERDNLAWNDGFRPDGTDKNFTLGAADLLLRWWKQTHQLPFLGDIIYWKRVLKPPG